MSNWRDAGPQIEAERRKLDALTNERLGLSTMDLSQMLGELLTADEFHRLHVDKMPRREMAGLLAQLEYCGRKPKPK